MMRKLKKLAIYAVTLAALALVALAVVLALQWEITYRRHPERFFESSNQALRCAACQEQLCAYKRRLRQKNQEKRLSE